MDEKRGKGIRGLWKKVKDFLRIVSNNVLKNVKCERMCLAVNIRMKNLQER